MEREPTQRAVGSAADRKQPLGDGLLIGATPKAGVGNHGQLLADRG
jgi:hypothetical protein